MVTCTNISRVTRRPVQSTVRCPSGASGRPARQPAEAVSRSGLAASSCLPRTEDCRAKTRRNGAPATHRSVPSTVRCRHGVTGLRAASHVAVGSRPALAPWSPLRSMEDFHAVPTPRSKAVIHRYAQSTARHPTGASGAHALPPAVEAHRPGPRPSLHSLPMAAPLALLLQRVEHATLKPAQSTARCPIGAHGARARPPAAEAPRPGRRQSSRSPPTGERLARPILSRRRPATRKRAQSTVNSRTGLRGHLVPTYVEGASSTVPGMFWLSLKMEVLHALDLNLVVSKKNEVVIRMHATAWRIWVTTRE